MCTRYSLKARAKVGVPNGSQSPKQAVSRLILRAREWRVQWVFGSPSAVVSTYVKRLALALMVFTWSTVATAQTLDAPTAIFAASAVTDWVTTHYLLQSSNGTREGAELNPLLRWAEGRPALMYSTAVALDVASVIGWKKLTKNHSRVQKIGLYAAAGARFYLAYRNYQTAQDIRTGRLR